MIDTYVINLDVDTEKWHAIQKKFSWKLTRISAIDGDKTENRPFFASRLIYGCLMSHRKAWEIIAKSNNPALVLEDDCQPLNQFENRLKTLLKTIPNDYDVAIMGYVASDVSRDYMMTAFSAPFYKKRCMKRVNEDWFVPGIFIGAHCYIITPEGARKLLANNSINHTDLLICSDKNINVYCPKETIATQLHKRKPILMYNNHISFEWMLSGALFSFGKVFTVRACHILLVILIFVCMAVKSRSIFIKVFLKIIVVLFFVHYLFTVVHISHNLKYDKTRMEKIYDKKQKIYHQLNDAFCVFTILILLWLGFHNNILVPMIDIMLMSILIRAIIIYILPMKDPSGICEEKSVSRNSLFDYCGTLRVSGHILPAVFLTYFMPKVGLFFMMIQTSLIMLSESHYAADVILGILTMSFILFFFNKKKLRCKKKSCLF